MKAQQVHGITPPPSLISIGVLGAFSIAVLAAAFWMLTGEVVDGRHYTGFLLGVLAGVSTLTQAVSRIGDRAVAQGQLRWALAQMEVNTANWDGPEGQRLTVTFCPLARHWHINGEIAPGWLCQDEVWTDSSGSLAQVLTEVERDGYRPRDDQGTRSVRARLAMPSIRTTLEEVEN